MSNTNETWEIGNKLVEWCKQGENLEAINNLYSENVVSIEAAGNEWMPQKMEGIEAVREKNAWWSNNNEVIKGEVVGPFPHENRFAVNFNYEIKNKQSGEVQNMNEVGLYTVENGKIVREEFFYPTEG